MLCRGTGGKFTKDKSLPLATIEMGTVALSLGLNFIPPKYVSLLL